MVPGASRRNARRRYMARHRKVESTRPEAMSPFRWSRRLKRGPSMSSRRERLPGVGGVKLLHAAAAVPLGLEVRDQALDLAEVYPVRARIRASVLGVFHV